jgi:hypothetical protein
MNAIGTIPGFGKTGKSNNDTKTSKE